MISTQTVSREVSCHSSLNRVSCAGRRTRWINPVLKSVWLSVCEPVCVKAHWKTSPHVHVFISKLLSSILCISTSGQPGPPLIHTVLVSQMLMMLEPSLSQTPTPRPPTSHRPRPTAPLPSLVHPPFTLQIIWLFSQQVIQTNHCYKRQNISKWKRLGSALLTHMHFISAGIILRLLEVIRYLF